MEYIKSIIIDEFDMQEHLSKAIKEEALLFSSDIITRYTKIPWTME